MTTSLAFDLLVLRRLFLPGHIAGERYIARMKVGAMGTEQSLWWLPCLLLVLLVLHTMMSSPPACCAATASQWRPVSAPSYASACLVE
jgi:Na+-transporting NADH:ubiquinone oxidoreductase subunit NqrB